MAFLRHYLLIFALCILYVESTDPSAQVCNENSNKTTTEITKNIDSLLTKLVQVTTQSGYDATSVGTGKAQVFGLAQCRRDISTEDCSSCIRNASQEIQKMCPNRVDARICSTRLVEDVEEHISDSENPEDILEDIEKEGDSRTVEEAWADLGLEEGEIAQEKQRKWLWKCRRRNQQLKSLREYLLHLHILLLKIHKKLEEGDEQVFQQISYKLNQIYSDQTEELLVSPPVTDPQKLQDYLGRFMEEGVLVKKFVKVTLKPKLYNVDAYPWITDLDERAKSFFKERLRKGKPHNLGYSPHMIMHHKYNTENFIGNVDTGYGTFYWNVENVTDPKTFNESLGALMYRINMLAAAPGSKGLGKGETKLSDFQTLYALSQCTEDLSQLSCRQCLAIAVGKFPTYCNDKKGCRIIYSSCYVRYELYPFFFPLDKKLALESSSMTNYSWVVTKP
ncbi:receptor-like protein kinase-related family protein [Artemisia annua]|uniref:Receptor-like protein kinase-related family protein n=1 Tax=Artemisia annua TaxID=35608 RepID=A0A2U1NN39_ARTAN|nr:receptor-like protein kinase-related family protein [Artemisia annua]